MGTLPFADRNEAGTALAQKLQTYSSKKNVLILSLVRGGVAVGAAMATALKLPLYPYVVRKLGHPHHREFGIGAVAEGGFTYLDDTTMHAHGVTWEEMEPVIEEEIRELDRRKEAYLIAARPSLAGKTVILTDDGAATGVTLFAAIEDLRKAKAKTIVVALPVCPPDTAILLAEKADELITLATPEPFDAVGKWYRDFPPLEDQEVLKLLQ